MISLHGKGCVFCHFPHKDKKICGIKEDNGQDQLGDIFKKSVEGCEIQFSHDTAFEICSFYRDYTMRRERLQPEMSGDFGEYYTLYNILPLIARVESGRFAGHFLKNKEDS